MLLKFRNWELVNFNIEWEIFDEKWNRIEDKDEVLKQINNILNEKKWNRFLWEIWFWTNPYIKPWIKNVLIWEKAFWVHISLWRSFKRHKEIDNWNYDVSMH